jgi:hypothetical protein
MFDLSTLLIYTLLLTSSFVLLKSRNGKDEMDLSLKRFNFRYLAFLVLISFVIGFRFEVGTDWLGYKMDYESFHLHSQTSFSDQYYEFGFYIISKFIASFGLGSEWMFLTMGCMSWLLIIKGIPSYLLPLVVFFLFADEYFFWSMNGVRQFAAIGFWILSLSYLVERKLIYFVAFILLGSLFHKSILLILPIYFIPFQRLYNLRVILVIFFISFFLGSFKDVLLNNISGLIEKFSLQFDTVARYNRYAEANRFFADETVLGLGFYLKIAINFFILVLSQKVIKVRPQLKFYFLLFAFGAIVFNVFYDVQLIGRLNNYFLILRSIVLAIIVYYYYIHFNKKNVAIGLVVVYLLFFFWSIYKGSNQCAPYNFIF